MTEETLSALLDGECSPAELDTLLDALDRDPNLRHRFSRLCLVRDAQHGTRWRQADPGFTDRVMTALDREPGPRVLAFRPRRTFPAWRPLAGLAAAAAIATVAVLVVRPAAAPAPETVALAPPEAVVSPQASTDRRWNQLDAEYARQLNHYLLTYNHSRAQQGMGSTLGYARYTAYTAEPRPADNRR